MSDWYEDARRLSAKGLSNAEVGRRLGRSGSAVWKVLHPEKVKEINRKDAAERNDYKRQWERDNRASCPECGHPMKAGSVSASKRSERCRACHLAGLERRRLEMVALRRRGMKNVEIARQLDTPVDAVAHVLYRERKLDPSIPRSPHYLDERKAA